MAFRKSSPEMVERFGAALPSHPDVVPRQMFGYPAAFVNGNFFTGLFEEDVLLRLPDAILPSVPEMRGQPVFNPMGRGKGMTGFYVVPERFSRDVSTLAVLLERALGPVRTLPAKEKKPAKAKTSEREAGRMTVPGTPAAKKAAARKRASEKVPAKRPSSKLARSKKAAGKAKPTRRRR